MSDNPIAASYLYLLEPEIRFLEAAVEHLIPTDELGPGARDAGVVVYIDRQLAGSWGARTAACIVAARGWRAPRSRAINRASRHRKSTASQFARSTAPARPRSSEISRSFPVIGNALAPAIGERRDRVAVAVIEILLRPAGATPTKGYFADPLDARHPRQGGLENAGFPGLPSSEYRRLVTSSEPYHAEPVSVLDVQTGRVPVDAEAFRSM